MVVLNFIKKLFCSHRYQINDNYEKWDGNPPYDCYKKQYTVYKCLNCKCKKTECKKVYL